MKGRQERARRASCLIGLVLTTIVLLAACGGNSDSERNVPEGSVAVIGDAEISNEQLNDRVKALLRARRNSAEGPRAQRADSVAEDQGDRQLREQALSLLLMAEAIEQEAIERGINISSTEVRDRWQTVAERQFPTQRALRRFLNGQPESDVVTQLRLQALSERINEQVAEQAGGGRKGARAAKRFQEEFAKRWKNETSCRDGLNAAGCPAD